MASSYTSQHINKQESTCLLEKGEETDQIANIRWIIEKARELKKNHTSISALLTMP